MYAKENSEMTLDGNCQMCKKEQISLEMLNMWVNIKLFI